MTSYTLALLPGDGIGRDVMDEAKKVLQCVADITPLSLTLNEIPCGGKYYLETGEEWPKGSFEFCRDEADAFSSVQLVGPEPRPKMATSQGVPSSWVYEVVWIFMQMSDPSNSMKASDTKFMASLLKFGNRAKLT